MPEYFFHTLNLKIDPDKYKKRSRRSITLETKLEILSRIEAGEKIGPISKDMGLARSTVQTIRDRKQEILTHLQSVEPSRVSKLTRRRRHIVEDMETLLDKWIEDSIEQGMPVSELSIRKKAKSIFEELRKDTEKYKKDVKFQASRAWFHHFRSRHNMYDLAPYPDYPDMSQYE